MRFLHPTQIAQRQVNASLLVAAHVERALEEVPRLETPLLVTALRFGLVATQEDVSLDLVDREVVQDALQLVHSG